MGIVGLLDWASCVHCTCVLYACTRVTCTKSLVVHAQFTLHIGSFEPVGLQVHNRKGPGMAHHPTLGSQFA